MSVIEIFQQLSACPQQVRLSRLQLLKRIPEESPRHEEQPHPRQPVQFLVALNKPVGEHPERPDASYPVKRNCDPELQRVSVRQMKEEPQMQNIRSGDGTRPERAAVRAGIRFHGH